MENELLSIGRMASLSGLTVSALRFYDGARVLTPAAVDPTSGYRYYAPAQLTAARLVAHLRRIGLPLDEIRTVLELPARATDVLAAHLTRLEAGLADARREISIVHRLLENPETIMTRFTLPAESFVQALRDVRYAVSIDPELPMLNGVFFDADGDVLRLVATDRYRLASSTVPNPDRAEFAGLLPTATVDAAIASFSTGEVTVRLDGNTITLSGQGRSITAELPDVEFPAYRAWLELGQDGVAFDADQLRRSVVGGPVETRTRDNDGASYDLTVLTVGSDGVSVGGDGMPVGVNREFLLQALESGDQLTLGLDGPIGPLAIRNPDRDGAFSLLMPVRLD